MSLQYTVAGVLALNKELTEEKAEYIRQLKEQALRIVGLEQENEGLREEARERSKVGKELEALREARLRTKQKEMKKDKTISDLRTKLAESEATLGGLEEKV